MCWLKSLRVIVATVAVIHWSASDGAAGEAAMNEIAFGLFFADLPTTRLAAGTEIQFVAPCEEKQPGEIHRVAIV